MPPPAGRKDARRTGTRSRPTRHSGSGEHNHSVQLLTGNELLTDRMRRSSPASRSYVLGSASGRSTLTPTRHQRAPATRTPNPTTPTITAYGRNRLPPGDPLTKADPSKMPICVHRGNALAGFSLARSASPIGDPARPSGALGDGIRKHVETTDRQLITDPVF